MPEFWAVWDGNLIEFKKMSVGKTCPFRRGEHTRMIDPTLSFVYNIIQIVVYASVISIGISLKISRNSKTAGPIVGLFLFILADSVVIFMTEFLPDFMQWYEVNFIRTPSLKMLIFLGTGFFMLLCWSSATGSVFTGGQGLLLFGFGLWLIFVPLLLDGAVESFLFFSGYQVFCICVSIYALWKIRKLDPSRLQLPAQWIWTFLIVTVVFCALIMAEDNYVIFYIDNYDLMKGDLNIYYRSVSEDLLRFVYSGLILSLFIDQLRRGETKRTVGAASYAGEAVCPAAALSTSEADSESGPVRTPAEYKRMKFARILTLTEREEEVLTLLIDGRSNQDISSALHISVGTVKAHVHGIYRKAKITHRYELRTLYEAFDPEESDEPGL